MAGGCAASRGGSKVTAVWTCAAACPGDRIVAAEGRKAMAPATSMVRAMVMVSPSPAGHADSFDRVATTTSTSPPGVRCGYVSNVQSPCGCARPPRRRDRRRFHPGGAEKRQEFAGADPEVDVIGGHNLTKPLGNASEFDVCRFGCQGRRGCR